MEGDWFVALIVLVVWGFIACGIHASLMGYPDSRAADAPMGKQILWGLVLASLVVASSAYAYFGGLPGGGDAILGLVVLGFLALFMLVVLGVIGAAAFAYLAPETKGQQIVWGIVIASLVVATTTWSFYSAYSDPSGLPVAPSGEVDFGQNYMP